MYVKQFEYYSWVSLCKCAVNLRGVNLNCIDVYTLLQREKSENDRKLHVFATKHEANTFSEHLINSYDELSRVRVDPH